MSILPVNPHWGISIDFIQHSSTSRFCENFWDMIFCPNCPKISQFVAIKLCWGNTKASGTLRPPGELSSNGQLDVPLSDLDIMFLMGIALEHGSYTGAGIPHLCYMTVILNLNSLFTLFFIKMQCHGTHLFIELLSDKGFAQRQPNNPLF